MADEKPRAMALGAHPDDVEFMSAGTLAQLEETHELHVMTVATGNCGTTRHTREEIADLRREESKAAVEIIGATYHPGITDDLAVFYNEAQLARVAAVVRDVNPEILLVPSLWDYMQDHEQTAILGYSAAFCKGMRNLICNEIAAEGDIFVYHALPYGLRDGVNKKIWAEMYVNTPEELVEAKKDMLRKHESQREWLKSSQAVDPVDTMAGFAEKVAKNVDLEREYMGLEKLGWKHAEGFIQRNNLGYAGQPNNRLAEILGESCWTDPAYAIARDMPPAQIVTAVQGYAAVQAKVDALEQQVAKLTRE